MVVYIKLEIKEAQRLGAAVTVQLSYHPVNRFVFSCSSDYFRSQAICWLERLSVISLAYITKQLVWSELIKLLCSSLIRGEESCKEIKQVFWMNSVLLQTGFLVEFSTVTDLSFFIIQCD